MEPATVDCRQFLIRISTLLCYLLFYLLPGSLEIGLFRQLSNDENYYLLHINTMLLNFVSAYGGVRLILGKKVGINFDTIWEPSNLFDATHTLFAGLLWLFIDIILFGIYRSSSNDHGWEFPVLLTMVLPCYILGAVIAVTLVRTDKLNEFLELVHKVIAFLLYIGLIVLPSTIDVTIYVLFNEYWGYWYYVLTTTIVLLLASLVSGFYGFVDTRQIGCPSCPLTYNDLFGWVHLGFIIGTWVAFQTFCSLWVFYFINVLGSPIMVGLGILIGKIYLSSGKTPESTPLLPSTNLV